MIDTIRLPSLKNVFIKDGIYAHQDHRCVILIYSDGREINEENLHLSELEVIRLENFIARLNDAWREYDASI